MINNTNDDNTNSEDDDNENNNVDSNSENSDDSNIFDDEDNETIRSTKKNFLEHAFKIKSVLI